MIDIASLNQQLVEQDAALRATLGGSAALASDDPAMTALAQLLTEGLCAIHERQGNLITLMLRTNT